MIENIDQLADELLDIEKQYNHHARLVLIPTRCAEYIESAIDNTNVWEVSQWTRVREYNHGVYGKSHYYFHQSLKLIPVDEITKLVVITDNDLEVQNFGWTIQTNNGKWENLHPTTLHTPQDTLLGYPFKMVDDIADAPKDWDGAFNDV